MRRYLLLPLFLIGPLTNASGEPGAVKTNGKIPIRTWFDVKQVVTHVEVQTYDFGAEFTTRGYRTDPPDVVTLFFKADAAAELKLADGETGLGSFKSTESVSTIYARARVRRFEIPRKVFEQWINSSHPSAQWGQAHFAPENEQLEALRELSRRMVTHKSLTLLHGRESLTASPLPDGRVLVAGGYDGFRALSECEIYDPVIGRFIKGPEMKFPRRGHTATMLKNGKILIAGGGVGGGDSALDSAELYDPATGRFTPAGKMRDARMNHSATLLGDGKVLIVGGGGKTPLAGVEVYDPATNSFHPAGKLLRRRLGHTATLLNDGKVMIIGGVDGDVLDSVELFDPETGVARTADAMSVPHWEHASLGLWDGTVWIGGGRTSGNHLCSQEIYSADGRRLESVECEGWHRWGHTMIAVSGEKYLSVGGCVMPAIEPPPPPPRNHAEELVLEQYPWNDDCLNVDIYTRAPTLPAGYSISGVNLRIYADSRATLLAPRRHFAAAPLKDGRWLLIGGVNQYQPAINTAEFYDPKTDEIVPWRDEPGGAGNSGW